MFRHTVIWLLCIQAGCATESEVSPNINNVATPAANEPGSSTISTTVLQVNYAAGTSCSAVVLTSTGGEIANSCRGWHVSGCRDMLLAQSEGITADEAGVILNVREGADRDILQIQPIIEEAIKRSFGVNISYLHLSFSLPQCTATAFEVPFRGSAADPNVSGPAVGFEGIVRIGDDGRYDVAVER